MPVTTVIWLHRHSRESQDVFTLMVVPDAAADVWLSGVDMRSGRCVKLTTLRSLCVTAGQALMQIFGGVKV